MNIDCAAFSSTVQTPGSGDILCQASCPENYYLNGDSTLVCRNGQFFNTNKHLSCDYTPCGNPSDHVSISQDVSFACTNDTCTFDCGAEISIVSDIVCDAATGQFKNQVLWADTGLPLHVTEIICIHPGEPTFCDDPYSYFVNFDTQTALFDCDFESNSCKVRVDRLESHIFRTISVQKVLSPS